MKRRSRVIVRGHRFVGDPASSLRGTPRVRKAIELFADELRTAVGEAVFERMKSGRWHTSRDPQYRYFRSMTRQRYGSSRRRITVGQDRFGGSPEMSRYSSTKGLDIRDTEEVLKFYFLAKMLQRQSVKSGDQYLVGPRKNAIKNRPKPLSELAGAYDVSDAIEKLDQTLAEYKMDVEEGNKATGRQKLQKVANDFLNGEYDHNRFFKETRLGQRYLRSANRAVQRHRRKDPSGLLDPDDDKDRTLRRVSAVRKRSASRDFRSGTKNKARSLGGNPSWGYQTGTLARAWRQARLRFSQKLHSYRMVIAPHNRREGKTPGPLMLTEYLKRNIRKQGGSPALLSREDARRAVRTALRGSQAEWAAMGIRRRRARRSQ